jgi:hypothetical protein
MRSTRTSSAQRTRAWRVGLAGAGLLACAAAGFALHHHLDRGARDAATATASQGWRQQWTPGLEYTFAFAWSGDTHAVLAEQSAAHVDVAYDVAGDLVARASAVGPQVVVELRIASLSRHTLKALGTDTVPTDDAARTTLETPRAWALVDASGALAQLRFPQGAPKPFRETMTKLVEQMQVTGPGDARSDWSATEPGPNGRADAMYHADGPAMTRVRVHYESVSALSSGACNGCRQHLTDHADITVDPRGVVAKLDDVESFSLAQGDTDAFASTNRFSLSLFNVAPARGEADPIAELTDERTPGERATMTSDDQRAVLEQEAAGFAPASLDYAIELFATKGEHVPDKTWLIHARAYLLLHPEAVEALGTRLQGEGVAPRGRDMMMQLLAVVGTPRAQEIMQKELDAARGSEPRALSRLVQKLGIVEHPTAATATYLQDAYGAAGARGDRGLALSDAAALGGIASKLKKSDPGAARGIVTRLEADLRSARTPEDKRGRILALRNAGAADDAEVRAYAKDDSAVVRAEVARSLGGDSTAEARSTLLSLSGDGEITVAQEAVQSLDRDAPTAADVHAFATSVLSGQTAPVLDGDVMDFFAGHMDDADDARSVLNFILGRTRNPVLARRVRALLQQLAI